MRPVVLLEEVSTADHALVGGKASKLGELVREGLPVPPGFVVTTDAYSLFVDSTALKEIIPEALAQLDLARAETVDAVSQRLRTAFEATPFPPELEKTLAAAFREYSQLNGVQYSAVRSSATAEDLDTASFAGLQDTYLNITGEEAILAAIRKCWGSLFTPRVLVYRARKGFDHASVRLAVLVQKMVAASVSGILFTRDPNTGENHMIVEAGWGLGEAIVGGEVTPDHYVVDGVSQRIVSKQISEQSWRLVRDDRGGNRREDVPPDARKAQKLPDDRIDRLVSLARVIQSHYRRPMDIEWCAENGRLYIVQARPVTTLGTALGAASSAPDESMASSTPPSAPLNPPTAAPPARPAPAPLAPAASGDSSPPLARGFGASPGVASGVVRKILRVQDSDRLRPGEILVTAMTTPDMVPVMAKAAGIVTDEGGMTCHAAIVSRELGIPCVVGTRTATQVLPEGEIVTVDGKMGTVRAGAPAPEVQLAESTSASGSSDHGFASPVTATKIYVNVSVPQKAAEYARLPVSGVGLLRIEFIFTSFVKEHPLVLLKHGKGPELVDRLAEGIATVCQAFYPRPVIVRTSDFKTNEYRGMPGGAEFEPVEENPMIGWRGCSRYVSPVYRPAFLLELEAIQRVRTDKGLKNAHLMLPFVRNTTELEIVAEMMKEKGLRRNRDFQLYLMAEVPSTVLMAAEFAKHCDGFSIGSNDLTQLVLGVDRDSETLGRMGYFDERDPAVLRAIELLIQGAHSAGRSVGICGQGPSVYPEFAEFLVREGIDSISLNADTVVSTTRSIAALEQRLKLNGMRAGKGT
ncbi:MAG: phosphoenolpyruvate synthase [Thermoplasmata archaeon]|nr:phosphoenolpyruvate synthase [Thermoplasmata archaeon]